MMLHGISVFLDKSNEKRWWNNETKCAEAQYKYRLISHSIYYSMLHHGTFVGTLPLPFSYEPSSILGFYLSVTAAGTAILFS